MGPVRRSERRGALILVVLSLLVLFALLGLAYLLSAGQHARSARAAHQRGHRGDPPRALLDRAFYQVVRGTRQSRSAMVGHDLLGDFYGHDGFRGHVTSARLPGGTGGQFVELRVDPSRLSDLAGASHSLRPWPGYYNGCVLTALDGPLRGTSCRIVGYDGRNTFRILRRPSDEDFAWTPGELRGTSLLVNGRPFNGAGFGFDPSTGRTDRREHGQPAALLPNRASTAGPLLGVEAFSSGGADEGYDAADYQNVALALLPVEPRDAEGPGQGLSGRGIPSFHRPALIHYWSAQHGGQLPDNLRRRIVLRPNRVDHPDFPQIDLVNGPWDVDNDGDLVADSVWIDVGLPVRRAPDGNLYRPLVAVLCVDLDGRLNLNAHGNRSTARLLPAPADVMLAGGETTGSVPRGQAYGPPEISLAGLFPVPGDYEALLAGDKSQQLPGRFGFDTRPGKPGVDVAARLRFFELPAEYLLTTTMGGIPSAFATPPDLLGRLAIGLDERGLPAYGGLGEPITDTPYDVDLSRSSGRGLSAAADSPFAVAELERLLRPYDVDAATLPDRLWRLVDAFREGPMARANRRVVTTDSYDPPAPAVCATPELQGVIASRPDLFPAGRPLHVIDLVMARLATRGAEDADLGTLLSPDLVMGLRMDLNRPWGDGRDNNGNGVVDDPSEAAGPEPLWGDVFSGVSFDHDNDGVVRGDSDARLARQYFARHLYVLMMLLTDEGYLHPVHADQAASLTTIERRELTATRLAQWAVNAVDFRDPDAIMSPFEFDLDPFDGWDVDGWLGTADDGHPQRRLVWGCEYPHLLMTETLAFHDTRLVDSRFDTSEKKRDDDEDGAFDPEKDDDDLDQARVPQGSLFVELYCPAPRQATVPPRELYTASGGAWRLDLGRLAPASRGVRRPVWRLAITAPHTKERASVRGRLAARPETCTLQPDRFDTLDPAARVSIERIVSFAGTAPPKSERGHTFYNRAGGPALLGPGDYAVVGPRRQTVIGSTRAGRDSPHVVRLDPAGGSIVEDNGAGPPHEVEPRPGINVRPAVGIVATAAPPSSWTNAAETAPEGIGLNVSEPLPSSPNYYPEPRARLAGRAVTDAYAALSAETDLEETTERYRDRPLDSSPGRPLADDRLLGEGTQPNYRTVFLERLADPLQPHDPVANPYVAVDWMPIDLTVFNGDDREPEDFPPGMKPWNPPQELPRRITLASRERGVPEIEDVEGATPSDGAALEGTTTVDLWRPDSRLGPSTGESGPDTLQFRHNLRHTLGYLNTTFGPPRSAPPQHVGDPPRPFPWLTWNDRPFAGPYELLLVPASSPQRLLYERTGAITPADDASDGGPTGGPVSLDTSALDTSAVASTALYRTFRGPYGHLLNFFHSGASSVATPAAHFHRLFDYVHVPSRFVGTETILDPRAFAAGPGTEMFHPPFNRVSNYRDPGRVNVNTIASSQVWNAILDGHPGPVFGAVADSRRGYPGARTFDLHPDYPTCFANPFRGASGGVAPLPRLATGDAECGLFRRGSPRGPASASSDAPPLFGWSSTREHESAEQNPYFFYRPFNRVGNLLTARSNVYAVWITLGNFQVDPVQPDGAHPDGYRLGRELGIETGEIRRHRAFYVIDRTIPVAYEPGVNHNVDRAVLLRRYVE